jgi:hypothetical protein
LAVEGIQQLRVMAGLAPAIPIQKAWSFRHIAITGTRPVMTREVDGLLGQRLQDREDSEQGNRRDFGRFPPSH